MRKIEFLDFAKGYAIFTIVCYHALQRLDLSPLLQKAIIFGGSGVHLFFLLSGFGLGLSSTVGSAGAFYRRRAVKVWLPYVLALSLSLVAAYTVHLFQDGWDAWLAGVGLYQMFFERYIHSFGGHFWFISAIMQFYLVFPLLLWLKNRFTQPWIYFWICLGISIGWWLVVFVLDKGGMRTWNSFFLQFLWEFALGQVLADLYKKQTTAPPVSTPRIRPDFWNYPWGWYLPAGLVFTGIMILMILKMGDAGKVFNDIPALFGYSALCIFLFRVGDLFFSPLKRVFLWIGGFSYSLYLAHVLVLDGWLMLLESQGISVNAAVLAAYLPLALLGGYLFEKLSVWWVGVVARGIN
ncbi:MAG: acyltransferase [Bacteroidota bacterium]